MTVDSCENVFTEMKEIGDKQGHWMGASVNLKVLPSGQPGQWSAGPGQCNDAPSRLRRQGLVSLDAFFCFCC